jgi:hypothetical protein
MRISTIGRNGVAAGAIGVLALGVGSVGVATAANGGSLLLGQSNTATHTTTLTDTSGPALSLKTKSGKAPLLVNSKGLVKHLNANLLDGVTATTLSRGTTSVMNANVTKVITDPAHTKGVVLPAPAGATLFPVTILSTNSLVAGTYQVNASFFGELAVCWAGTNSAQGARQYGLAAEGSGSLATSIKVLNHQKIHTYCAAIEPPQQPGAPAGAVFGAGMNVIRVQQLSQGTSATPKPIPTGSASPAAP